MKIYKYRDLRRQVDRQHFVQIVLEKSVWCARPDSLNDGEEFRFHLDYRPSEDTAGLLTEVLSRYGTDNHLPPALSAAMALQNGRLAEIAVPIIEGIVQQCRATLGIVSFSLSKEDDHLWAEYGGEGNGAYIEIDLPDSFVGSSYHRVHYVEEKVFHIDAFLRSAIAPDQRIINYRNILLTKTRRWHREDELRFIGKMQDVKLSIDGSITEIGFGPKVPDEILNSIIAEIEPYCGTEGIRLRVTGPTQTTVSSGTATDDFASLRSKSSYGPVS